MNQKKRIFLFFLKISKKNKNNVVPIDIISHENIFSIWDLTASFEKLKQIKKLSMNITANIYRGSDGMDIRFLHQNFFSFIDNFS